MNIIDLMITYSAIKVQRQLFQSLQFVKEFLSELTAVPYKKFFHSFFEMSETKKFHFSYKAA